MLNWLIKRMKRDQKGFTLIELIVVIAILGVLAAIAVPNVTGALSKARGGSDVATAATIAHAAERYIAENPDINPLDVNNNLIGDVDEDNVLVSEKYLDRTPEVQDKSKGNVFYLKVEEAKNGNSTAKAGGYTVKVYYDEEDANKLLYPPSQDDTGTSTGGD